MAMAVLTACHSVETNPEPKAAQVEVRVLRTAPAEATITLGHHGEEDFIDAVFLVLEPKAYEGRTFRIKIMPESHGALFAKKEFRLRIPENIVFGANRESKNPDGTTK